MLVRVSGHALIIARRVRAHRFDVDTVEQPVQLFGSQFEHGFFARPHEAILFEPLVTYLGMQALSLPRHGLSA